MPILLNYPLFHADDDNGAPLTGGLLYSYIAGSSTNKATYTTRAMTTANANPVVLNSRGEAVIYGSGLYKLVLKTSAGVTIWTQDNVELGPGQGAYSFFVDPSEVDQGAAGTGASLYDILTALGSSKKATVYFPHNGTGNTTTYTFSTTYDASAYTNVTFDFENGALPTIATGITLTLPSPDSIIAQPNQQIFSLTGTGAVRFGKSGDIHVGWWGALGNGDIGAATGTNDYTAVLAACEAARALYDTDITKSPWVVFQNARTYRLESTLFIGRNATNANWVQRIKGNGAVLWGVHTGGYVLDYTGAHEHIIQDLMLYGDATLIPAGGLLKARKAAGSSGGQLRATHLDIQGTYSVAALILSVSEENHFIDCNFEPLAGISVAIITDTGYYKDSAGTWTILDIPNDDSFAGTSTCMNNSFTACRFWHRKAAPSSAAAIIQLIGADRVGFKSCHFDETANDMPVVEIAQDNATRSGTRCFYNNFSDCTFHGTYESAIQVDGCVVDYLSVKNCKMGTSSIADIYASAASSFINSGDIQCNDINFSAATSGFTNNSHLNVILSLNVSRELEGEVFMPSTATLTLGDSEYAKATVYITDTGLVYHYGRPLDYTPREATLGSGNIVLTAAALIGGYIQEDPEGAANWTTDTAANIIAAIPYAKVGSSFTCYLHNAATNGSSEVVTLVGGTDVTLRDELKTLTEGKNTTAQVFFVVTSTVASLMDAVIITGEIDT